MKVDMLRTTISDLGLTAEDASLLDELMDRSATRGAAYSGYTTTNTTASSPTWVARVTRG
jgi:hypothetical protein